MVHKSFKESSTSLILNPDLTKADVYDIKYGSIASSNERSKERALTDSMVFLKLIFNELNINNKSHILNVGINDGKEMSSLGFSNVTGTDISETSLRRGKDEFKSVNFTLSDVEDLPFTDNSFDFIISLRTLQCSLIDLEKAMSEMNRVLKSGKMIIVSSPTGYLDEDGTVIKGLMSKGKIDSDRAVRELDKIEHYFSKYNFQIIKLFEHTIETFIVAAKTA